MNKIPLTHFGTLKVSGADAARFLQGQLTCDIHELKAHTHQLGAFCNRQGRVLALMDIFRVADDYFLTLPQELIEIIHKELQKYIVFSKATIENITQAFAVTVNNDFLLMQMRAHIPYIGQAQTGQFLPHPIGLVKLGAVSFKKGCFVGQEIIARMQHRATLTKELHYFEIPCTQIPAVGEAIMLDEHHSGILVNALPLAPGIYAVLVITDVKMLYTTTD
jgi:folate-binding protein YgfZ